MKTLSEKERQGLATLVEAICDTGFWSYWSAHKNVIFQAEFEGVQLWNSSLEDPTKKPSSRVAIRFEEIQSIEFLLFTQPTANVPLDWPTLMSQDKLALTQNIIAIFNEKEAIEEASSEAIHRSSPFKTDLEKSVGFYDTRFQGFVRSGGIGFRISFNTMGWLTNPDENLTLEEVPAFHEKWWSYWKRYWAQKNTDQPLPYDPTCEITIPIK